MTMSNQKELAVPHCNKCFPLTKYTSQPIPFLIHLYWCPGIPEGRNGVEALAVWRPSPSNRDAQAHLLPERYSDHPQEGIAYGVL